MIAGVSVVENPPVGVGSRAASQVFGQRPKTMPAVRFPKDSSSLSLLRMTGEVGADRGRIPQSPFG